jgi:hypothetical protein
VKSKLVVATIFLFVASAFFLAIGILRSSQTAQVVLALACLISFAWGVLSTADQKRFGWLSSSEKEWAGMQAHSKSWLAGIGFAVFLLFVLDWIAVNYFSVFYLSTSGAILCLFWLGRLCYWLRANQ